MSSSIRDQMVPTRSRFTANLSRRWIMITDTEREEFLAAIRKEVCAHCKERPPGGPPCAPLGKACGVELYLPELIEAIREVQGDSTEPYQQMKQRLVCARCAYLHSNACPCPMDYWFVPIVQVVQAVDQRRGVQARGHQFVTSLPRWNHSAIEAISR